MKKLILLLFIFQNITVMSQITLMQQKKEITIGKVFSIGDIKAEIGSDTTYYFTFSNHKYPALKEYKTLSFKGGKATLDQLYGLMMSVFTEENKNNKDYKQEIRLGDEPVIIATYKSMGTFCQFHTLGAYVNLSENHIKKLFGKK